MKYLFAALWIAAAPFAHAGDASKFKPLGFSADGRYYAFAQVGSFDGSGAAYAEVSVVEVAKNDLVATNKFRFDDGDSENLGTEEQALAAALKGARLARFGIKEGRNLGEDLLLRLPNDLSDYASNVFTPEFWAEGGASASLPRYEVQLSTRPAGKGEAPDEFCTSVGYSPELLTVSLRGVPGTSQESFRPRLLQKDQKLPKSRGCALNYAVKRITLRGDSLVIALTYQTPGFEGPDVRSMVVTGKVRF